MLQYIHFCHNKSASHLAMTFPKAVINKLLFIMYESRIGQKLEILLFKKLFPNRGHTN